MPDLSAAPINLKFLQGGGELGALIRAKDWSQTPIGQPETWPQSLRTAVSLCLASNFPINIVWGPGHVQIYNDAYRAGCGDAHPQALGEDYRITWASAWPVIGKSFERAQAGETRFLENQRMFLRRLNGELAETFFTFSHSPIRDESGDIGGLFHPVTETTPTMLAERRTRALRDLATSLAAAEDEIDIARRTVEVLADHDADLPFLLFYRLDSEAKMYRLDRTSGLHAGAEMAPSVMDADASRPWPVTDALLNGTVEVGNLAAQFDGQSVGPYPEAPERAFLIPVPVPSAQGVPALIVAGVSSRLPLDDAYRNFYRLLGVTVANALATVRALEDERSRAAALAEIDRAKTAFFSNVSHEFRTPLTLMLGPIEDALADGNHLPLKQRERLDIAHRNSLRLLRLVNALLDFSRIEAGRTGATFRSIDLAALTADLASSFRSATDRAGLTLAVDTPPLSQPAFIDRDMWEKIVLNLLSNAFKFTFEGEIAITLREADDMASLVIRDTGTGIPSDELPKLFDRFHRVEGARGRSFEGSGIGLSLVQELVSQLGGAIAVESEVGHGTIFTVTLPLGATHLSADQIADAFEETKPDSRSAAFVEEALRWLPDDPPKTNEAVSDAGHASGSHDKRRRRILVADDNADLREYLTRMLVEQGYEVEVASNGDAALERLGTRPFDLVITDVMMPGTDGFELLDAVRGDYALRDLPVILLSARAGEEARVEGLEAGADDYLTKPFSGRELLARVAAAINIAEVRREGADALRAVNDTLEEQVAERTAERDRMWETSPDLMLIIDFDGYFRRVNPAWTSLLGYAPGELVGHHVNEFVLPDDQRETVDAYELAAAGGLPRIENRYRHKDGSTRWISWVAAPAGGLTYATGRDVTREKERQADLEAAQEALRQSQKLEAVGQLTGGVAHDFNNLLTIIRSSVDLLRRPDVREDRRARYLDAMSETVDRAAKLTGQLLAFARRQALMPEIFDVGAKLRGLTYMLDTVTGSRVQVAIETPGNPCFIKADVSQFETALVNMAANARDAMDGEGRLTLQVECGQPLPAIRGHAGSHSLFTVVAVTDTGSGIAADQIAHIFEPFFTTKEVGKGTGLGLSQVFGFAKQSGGDVDVESRPGAGTTFRLYLPEAEAEHASADDTEGHTEAVPMGQGQCVLVVEDNLEVGQFCVQILHDLNYTADRAANAEEALEKLGRDGNGYDAVFSDVVMPGMGGVELARTLRDALPTIPVILTSGYSHILAHEDNHGFELLHKPYSADRLAIILHRVLPLKADVGPTKA